MALYFMAFTIIVYLVFRDRLFSGYLGYHGTWSCRPGRPGTQTDVCLCFLSSGIEGVSRADTVVLRPFQ